MIRFIITRWCIQFDYRKGRIQAKFLTHKRHTITWPRERTTRRLLWVFMGKKCRVIAGPCCIPERGQCCRFRRSCWELPSVAGGLYDCGLHTSADSPPCGPYRGRLQRLQAGGITSIWQTNYLCGKHHRFLTRWRLAALWSPGSIYRWGKMRN